MNAPKLIALVSASCIALASTTMINASSDSLNLDFDNGTSGWRVVLDGVMGGRSSGRVTQPDPGILRFTGNLSLENNGGFSQIRRQVSGEQFNGAEGVAIRVRGDGRVYTFDIRASNARLMAGAYQRQFQTEDGVWSTIEIPFDDFRLYNFGREVRNAPELNPALIESIGVTLGDKRTGPFEIEIDSIRAFGGTTSAAPSGGNDLASVATGAGLTTVLDLIAAAELTLPENESVTIFAPTNEAFAALPKETVAALLKPEGRDLLRSILTYHVAAGEASSSDLLSQRAVTTLNGQRVVLDTSSSIRIGDAKVLAVDVPFDGGVVHVIDRVLMPETRTLAELAGSTEQLSTLTAAVGAARLGDVLGPENGPFTVFAPVDSAFAQLPASTLEALLQPENRNDLVQILGLHVLPGRIYANEFLANGTASTYFGEPVSIELAGGAFQVNGSTVIAKDIEASNGVVHLIDTVLLPSASADPIASSSNANVVSPSAMAEAARLCELAVKRGAPLYNDGQREACAAIYELMIESIVAFGADELDATVVQRLSLALAEAETHSSATDRAWVYRRAMDQAYLEFTKQAHTMQTTASR